MTLRYLGRRLRAAPAADHDRRITQRVAVAAVAAAALGALSVAHAGDDTATYKVRKTLVAQDEYKGEKGLVPKPLFKPHDARVNADRENWIVSNERTGCAGITIFRTGSDDVLAKLFIDEPTVAYHADESSSAGPCVGSVDPTPAPEEPPEGTDPPPESQFPAENRFNPSLCLPVVLPPGQTEVPVTGVPGITQVKSPGPGLVCAPLGTEQHARHPHGITIDYDRKIAYQVIEHSGLRWNANRTAFEVANRTDEESGMTLAYDVRDPSRPKVLKAYLNGHGAHEVVVNQKNGVVFQGNHEDSPGVTPPIWVDVINPRRSNPYGFIDTGYFNAIQGIDVNGKIDDDEIASLGDENESNIVYGATHVGEKIFAFDGNCVPQVNPPGVVPPPAPPGYSLPAGDSGMKMGWNCILWWVDIRPAFLAAFPELATILTTATPPSTKPNVLHQHNLAADRRTHRAFAAIHSIHDAEHTGLDDEEPPAGTEEEADGHHFMGRWVAQASLPRSVDNVTKKADAPVSIIDLSHGYDVLQYPNAEDVLASVGLPGLLTSFVHAHFLVVDPRRNTLLVTGEHTGNLGVVDLKSGKLRQVIPISRQIPGCTPPPPEPGQPAEVEEPHVHGVTIDPKKGRVYVSDEGEHCFYESVTILEPGDKD